MTENQLRVIQDSDSGRILTQPATEQDIPLVVAWLRDQGVLPDLLAGVSELATRYEVQANTVAVWTQRHQDFPEPLIQVGGRVRVWWVPEVDEWYNQRQR